MPNKYYVTFGQKSPFRDGYVIIEAYDYSAARQLAFEVLGENWAFIRKDLDPHFFPAGQFGRTLNA